MFAMALDREAEICTPEQKGASAGAPLCPQVTIMSSATSATEITIFLNKQ